MEFNRCSSDKGTCWVISGDLDDDSYLKLESMIMNSQDIGLDIDLDVSGLDHISMAGAGSLRQLAVKARERGSDLRVIGARDVVRRRLEVLDLIGPAGS